MKIKKIVLTGGPCAGKTTALKNIKEYLNSKNIPVITIPETATELILNGINPKNVPVYDFQKLVLKKQYSKETIADIYARLYGYDKDTVIIIYDRGIIDNMAYLEQEEDFDKLIKEINLNEINVLDKYDLVLDLLSTATCKPEVYNLLNEARMEDVEKAKEVDQKTSNSWIHHRNLKIINSSLSLEDETITILQIIDDFLNNNYTKNTVTYLLDENSNLEIYNKENSKKLNITNYTIYNDDEYKYVLSKRKYKNNTSYIYQIYKENNNLRTFIEDKAIDKNKFYEILKKYQVIHKEKFEEINFLYNNLKYKICVYNDYKILQIEDLTNNLLQIPDNLSIIKNNIKRKIR